MQRTFKKRFTLSFYTQCFVKCFEGAKALSKYSRTALHNQHQNTQKPRFTTISVLKWKSCGLSKYLNCHHVQALQKSLQAPQRKCLCYGNNHKTRFVGSNASFHTIILRGLPLRGLPLSSYCLAALPSNWVFSLLWSETFWSYVRNSVKASANISFSDIFYEFKRHYEQIGFKIVSVISK